MNHEFSDDAIDALVAASLRQAYSSDAPTEASIAAAIKAAAVEEPEDAARLQRIRERLATSTSQPQPAPRRRPISGQVMAMNRKNEDDAFSEPTQTALDEARKKAIKELLDEEEKQEGGADDHS